MPSGEDGGAILDEIAAVAGAAGRLMKSKVGFALRRAKPVMPDTTTFTGMRKYSSRLFHMPLAGLRLRYAHHLLAHVTS